MSLRSTLAELKRRDGEVRAVHESRGEFLASWQEDVRGIFAQIKLFLKEYQEDGSIVIEDIIENNSEPLLGDYDIPALLITVSSIVISVSPYARTVIGASGRIDMFKRDRPARSDRVVILRKPGENGVPDYWVIEHKPRNFVEQAFSGMAVALQATSFKPFEKVSFETALDFLLNLK